MFNTKGMASILIKAIIFNRVNKAGKTEIKYRVTIDRKPKYFRTNIFIDPKTFDLSFGLLKPKTNRAIPINTILSKTCDDFQLAVAAGTVYDFDTAQRFFEPDKATTTDFYEYANKYIDSSINYSAGYARNFRIAIEQLHQYRPNLKLAEVNNTFLHEYIRKLTSEGKLPATIAGKLKFIKVVLNQAFKSDDLDFFKIDATVKKGEEKIKFLQWNEVERIQALIYDERKPPYIRRCSLWFCLAAETGMRYGDLLKCIDKVQAGEVFEDEIFHFSNKTAAANPIPLTKNAKKYLALLSIDPFDVRIYSNEKYNETLKTIQLMCNIDVKLSTHVARHTCATNLLNNGVSLDVVQQMLGHASRRMTERYAKIINTTLRKAISDFDRNR
jgi:site-specific recombinase XerD